MFCSHCSVNLLFIEFTYFMKPIYHNGTNAFPTTDRTIQNCCNFFDLFRDFYFSHKNTWIDSDCMYQFFLDNRRGSNLSIKLSISTNYSVREGGCVHVRYNRGCAVVIIYTQLWYTSLMSWDRKHQDHQMQKVTVVSEKSAIY